ncbi:MAG: O-antigen ligase family protein [Dehalococcoidales bacterium]|nr:MAG: O-antigen ligase family protein [Dehalococcoidales bacterium]
MTTIAYPIRWYENQRLYIGVAAVAALTWLGATLFEWAGPLSFVLAAQLVLFVFLFQRPILAIGALIVGQFTANSFMFDLPIGEQISVRFLWTVLAIVLLVPIVRNRGGIKLGSGAKWVIIPAIIFFVIAATSNFVNTDISNTLKYFRLNATALAILILLPAVVEKKQDLKLLSIVTLGVGSISAIVAIMQHYSTRWGLPVYTISDGIYRSGRAVGLAESPVHIAYDLPLIILPTLGVLLLKGVSPNARKILMVLVLAMGLGLYFSYTRSGIYALAAGVFIMVLFSQIRFKKELVLITLVLTVGFLLWTDINATRYSQWFTNDQSGASRLVLWQSGVNVALDNPALGIGYDEFLGIAPEYLATVNPAYAETEGAGGVLGVQEPHNDFIRVWLSFGTPALLALLWLFFGMFRNFTVAYRQSSDLFIKGLSIGCIGALVAYVVNASIHNVMDSVFFMWILAGLSIALTKFIPAQQNQIEREG